MAGGWVGFDLDGTLANYGTWQGIEYIGQPIKPMVDKLLEEYKRHDVKIFTARAGEGKKAIQYIQAWLVKNGMPKLEVTDRKDFSMIKLYDDRCVQVELNTGRIIGRE